MNAPDCICSPGRLPLGAFCAGRDDLERETLHDDRISIRAPRAGCDHYTLHVHLGFGIFQSTRPVWGATDPYRVRFGQYQISIHAPRVGRDQGRDRVSDLGNISIHAPRVGRDYPLDYGGAYPTDFNPRAPCGARLYWCARPCWNRYFNPRAPCGARLDRAFLPRHFGGISIHAPRVGRDGFGCLYVRPGSNFNPRAPCGARPHRPQWGHHFQSISIHAPRVGRDDATYLMVNAFMHFNPRAPCGARHV